MGETALPIPAPACDNPQLPVAPNYLWSLKRLMCSFIPRTNSFLETFLRDKGTKKPKSPRYFGGGEGRASERARILFFVGFFFNVSCISPLLYTSAEQNYFHVSATRKTQTPRHSYLIYFLDHFQC